MTIIIGIGVVLAALLGFVATRPDTYRVIRSMTIKAPPEKVFPFINDFHQWGAWSPWEQLDPAMKRSHRGPASGTGAIYEWDGNKKAGKGRMEITGSSPNTTITIKLDFLVPFESHNTTTFSFAADGGATTVTWVMEGPNLLMNKIMSLVVSMDRMIGKDFEAGLANLTTVAER